MPKHTPVLLISGVGLTRLDQGYALKVNLAAPPHVAPPTEVDGVPVKIEVTGSLHKRAS